MSRLPIGFSPLRHRDFRLLWSGSLVSNVGTWMQKVAQGWLVLTLTGSPFWLGVDAFLGDAPFLAFSLLGGVLADRAERRRILLVSQLVQMTCSFTLDGARPRSNRVTLGVDPLDLVPLRPRAGVRRARVPGALPDARSPPRRSRRRSRSTRSSSTSRGSSGRRIAGLAFARLGAAGCMGLNGLSFLAVVVALLAIPRHPAAGSGGASLLEGLKEGIGVVWTRPALRGLVGLAFLGSFCSTPLLTFLPVFAKEVFHGGPGRYSAFLAAFGCGAVLGGVVVATTSSRMRRRGLTSALGLVAFGLLTVAFGLSRSLVLSFALLVAAGACLMVVFSSLMTLVQTSVGDELRGRVVSIYGARVPRRDAARQPVGRKRRPPPRGRRPSSWRAASTLVVAGGAVAARRRKDGVAAM